MAEFQGEADLAVSRLVCKMEVRSSRRVRTRVTQLAYRLISRTRADNHDGQSTTLQKKPDALMQDRLRPVRRNLLATRGRTIQLAEVSGQVSFHYRKSPRHLTGSRSVRRASLVERIEGSGMHEGRLHL